MAAFEARHPARRRLRGTRPSPRRQSQDPRRSQSRAHPQKTDTVTAGALPSDADIAAVSEHLRRVARDAPDDIRKAVTQAFVADLRVEQARRVKPTFRILPALPPPAPDPDDNPEHGRGVRAMTDPVGGRGLEPPTSAV